ncbi:MAG: hypothetical protein H6752_10375 [Candidatus Omnitrophica bacterium]|nr:hypothetical protein [Candidatus Omnitrophota bacterium]
MNSFLFAAIVLLSANDSGAVGSSIGEDETSPQLSVTISCDVVDPKVGDEIPIIFEIKNEGESHCDLWYRGRGRDGRCRQFKLSAVDEGGEVVADPRADRQIFIAGGGGGIDVSLDPDESFRETIALNRWALLTHPGVYQVTGTFYARGPYPTNVSVTAVTATTEIEILPRSNDEMASYIGELSNLLPKNDYENVPFSVVQKLMYTCDRRAALPLIEVFYRSDAARYWAVEAFQYYLPKDRETDQALLEAAMERGLAKGMFSTLRERGFTCEQIKPLIEASLAIDHPNAWPEGALAAQICADDCFTERLIAIATDPTSYARKQAIAALAKNRTDDSVAALKGLLEEPESPQMSGMSIRQWTEQTIRRAYRSRGISEGRPLETEDFDACLQKETDYEAEETWETSPVLSQEEIQKRRELIERYSRYIQRRQGSGKK